MRVDGIGTFKFDMRKTLNANFASHLVLGASPLFTTIREKEQEELPKAMRLQERKGEVKKESGTQSKSNLIRSTKFIQWLML